MKYFFLIDVNEKKLINTFRTYKFTIMNFFVFVLIFVSYLAMIKNIRWYCKGFLSKNLG